MQKGSTYLSQLNLSNAGTWHYWDDRIMQSLGNLASFTSVTKVHASNYRSNRFCHVAFLNYSEVTIVKGINV